MILGDCRKRIDRIVEDVCSASRRGHERIAGLCAHVRNKEDGHTDPQAGLFFDRNRLNRLMLICTD